jgi:hypothetical protein
MFAEAIVRIGQDSVAKYLTAAARRVGWPIPSEHRHNIITGTPFRITVRGFAASQPQPASNTHTRTPTTHLSPRKTYTSPAALHSPAAQSALPS